MSPVHWVAIYVAGVVLVAAIAGFTGEPCAPELVACTMLWPLFLPFVIPFGIVYIGHRIGRLIRGRR